MPELSVCITTYNLEKYIDETMQSVISQNTKYSFEILVGDDGSSDNTLTKIKEWKDKYPSLINYYQMPREKDKKYNFIHRAAANRINLMKHAKGKYITFLDGDDLYKDDIFFEKAISILENNPDCTACAGDTEIFLDNGYAQNISNIPAGKITLEEYWEKHYTAAEAAIYRNEFKIPSKYKNYFDDDMIIFMALMQGKLYSMGCVTARYRQRENTFTKGTSLEKSLYVITDYDITCSLKPDIQPISAKKYASHAEIINKNKEQVTKENYPLAYQHALEANAQTILKLYHMHDNNNAKPFDLAGMLPETGESLNILVLESNGYLPEIRGKMPQANIYAVTYDMNAGKNPAYKDYNINWINLNIWEEPLELPKDNYDYIISENAVSLVPDLDKFVYELNGLLKQTGELLLTVPNTLHWQSLQGILKNNTSYGGKTIWDIEAACRIVSGNFFNDVRAVSSVLSAPDNIREKLIAAGYDNANNRLDINKWYIQAHKPNKNIMQLKQHYSAAARESLTALLRRIEYGIEAYKNTKALILLCYENKITASYLALYIRLVVVLHDKFLRHFMPAMIKENQFGFGQKILQNLINYQCPAVSINKWLQPVSKIDIPEEIKLTRVRDCIGKSKALPEKTIAFISCVNNDKLYDEALVYINNLIVPSGYNAEIIAVRDGKSMCNGYNKGMKRTKAKYKVYLHQDCLLVNENFIEDTLKVFSDEKIGIMGAVGPKQLPASGISWQGDNYGRLLHATDTELIFPYNAKNPAELYEEVECVDGLMIATQYDIPWREDLFDNWHLYDSSQCLEMKRKGYKTAVPHQDECWFIHCPPQRRLDPGYKKYQRRFLNEYGSELLINQK